MNKYRNKKIIVDGIEFDSKLEANRYCQLRILEKAKEIKNLRRQVEYIIQEGFKKNNKTIRPIKYVADFVYYDLKKKKIIIEDTKGYKNEVYKIKKKIFEYKYPDLEITEIRREDMQ